MHSLHGAHRLSINSAKHAIPIRCIHHRQRSSTFQHSPTTAGILGRACLNRTAESSVGQRGADTDDVSLSGSSPAVPPSLGPSQQQRLLSALAAACARAACVAAVLAVAQHLLPASSLAASAASAAPASSNPIAGVCKSVDLCVREMHTPAGTRLVTSVF